MNVSNNVTYNCDRHLYGLNKHYLYNTNNTHMQLTNMYCIVSRYALCYVFRFR